MRRSYERVFFLFSMSLCAPLEESGNEESTELIGTVSLSRQLAELNTAALANLLRRLDLTRAADAVVRDAIDGKSFRLLDLELDLMLLREDHRRLQSFLLKGSVPKDALARLVRMADLDPGDRVLDLSSSPLASRVATWRRLKIRATLLAVTDVELYSLASNDDFSWQRIEDKKVHLGVVAPGWRCAALEVRTCMPVSVTKCYELDEWNRYSDLPAAAMVRKLDGGLCPACAAWMPRDPAEGRANSSRISAEAHTCRALCADVASKDSENTVEVPIVMVPCCARA